MPIKFAARGISSEFVTPDALALVDGVVLKPIYGREVLVWSTADRDVKLGTSYRDSGGCKIAGTEYVDTQALQDNGFYVLEDALQAFDCWETPPQAAVVCTAPAVSSGDYERRFLYHGQLRSLDETHYLGILFGGVPESVPVHGITGGPFSGDAGIRYSNDDGFFVRCTTRLDNSEYYATLDEVNAAWAVDTE